MYRKIVNSQAEYPRYLSPMAKSILKGLLMKNPEQRLGAKYGIQEIKDHPFCRDIVWEDVAAKKQLPPIRPSQKYSNFDPEYTSLPVRFTYEEDFMQTSTLMRRKSDPGLLQPIMDSGCQVVPAIVYPNFIHDRISQVME